MGIFKSKEEKRSNKIWKKVDGQIASMIFPRGKAEFDLVITILNSFWGDRFSLETLIQKYGGIYSYCCLKNRDIIDTKEFLVRNNTLNFSDEDCNKFIAVILYIQDLNSAIPLNELFTNYQKYENKVESALKNMKHQEITDELSEPEEIITILKALKLYMARLEQLSNNTCPIVVSILNKNDLLSSDNSLDDFSFNSIWFAGMFVFSNHFLHLAYQKNDAEVLFNQTYSYLRKENFKNECYEGELEYIRDLVEKFEDIFLHFEKLYDVKYDKNNFPPTSFLTVLTAIMSDGNASAFRLPPKQWEESGHFDCAIHDICLLVCDAQYLWKNITKEYMIIIDNSDENETNEDELLNKILDLVPGVFEIYYHKVADNVDEILEALTYNELGFNSEDIIRQKFMLELMLYVAATDIFAIGKLLSIEIQDAVITKCNEYFDEIFDAKKAVFCRYEFNKYIDLHREDNKQKTLFDYTTSYFIQQILGDNIDKYSISMFNMMACQTIIVHELGVWKWALEDQKII